MSFYSGSIFCKPRTTLKLFVDLNGFCLLFYLEKKLYWGPWMTTQEKSFKASSPQEASVFLHFHEKKIRILFVWVLYVKKSGPIWLFLFGLVQCLPLCSLEYLLDNSLVTVWINIIFCNLPVINFLCFNRIKLFCADCM